MNKPGRVFPSYNLYQYNTRFVQDINNRYSHSLWMMISSHSYMNYISALNRDILLYYSEIE